MLCAILCFVLFSLTVRHSWVLNSKELYHFTSWKTSYVFIVCRKKENMKTVNEYPANIERRLFHGTKPDSVDAICNLNFDWRLHGKNATLYGEGSYFALSASYSDAYTKEDVNSSRFMFLAKVLVGTYTKGYSRYRRPPKKDESSPASNLYDSCVNSTSSPSVFVIFDMDQSYPEYIIEYVSDWQATYGGFLKPRRPLKVYTGKRNRSQNTLGTPSVIDLTR